MIFKRFSLLLPYANRLLIPCSFTLRVIAPLSSRQHQQQQQPNTGDAKPIKAAGPRKGRQQKDKDHQINLTGLLKSYRTKMGEAENKLAEMAYHCKKIANYYKKTNHAEFLDQKAQLESLLTTVAEFNYTGLQFSQYCGLLDFIRICGRLQTLAPSIFGRANEKVCGLLGQFDKKVESLGLEELSTLYCKVTPLYHPDTFKISGLLHDLMASELQEKQKLSLSLMQLYVLTRSMGKKDFLSFPDKKILQMILLSLKERNIDSLMTIQLAVALKDLQVEVNISDAQIFGISRNIQERALNLVEKGLPYTQIHYLLTTKRSDNPYFARIFMILAKKSLQSLADAEKAPDYKEFRHFSKLLPYIPKSQSFSAEDRLTVVHFLERYYERQKNVEEQKKTELDLLEMVRHDFFGSELCLLDRFFTEKLTSFIWSFPLQYSRRRVSFPLQVLQSKITANTSIFRMQSSNLKIAVALALQYKLQPSSSVLADAYQAVVSGIQKHEWSMNDLEQMLRFAVYDFETVKQFHQEYSMHYLRRLAPTKEEMKAQKEIKRGEKSSLLRFWQYMLIQGNPPLDIITKVPEYAIFLSCYRQKKIKNQQLHPKGGLLLAISLKLTSGRIKFADQQSQQILDLLIIYSGALPFDNQRVVELYFNIVGQLIDQYGLIRRTALPYANYLLGRLLVISDSKFVNSQYYSRFLGQLVQAIGLLTISPSYSYLRTSVIRQGLAHNLISENHLSQVDIAHFTLKERNLLLALLNRYQAKEINSQGLLCLLKLQKLPEDIADNFDRITSVIQSSPIQQLADYLTHYSFQSHPVGNKILEIICEQFVNKLDLGVNMLSVLRNLSQLASSNFQLYKRLILRICEQLAETPTSIYLADHFYILKLLHQHSITCPKYEQSLAAYNRTHVFKSTAFISITNELSFKNQSLSSSADVDLADQLSASEPFAFFQLLIIHEQSIDFSKRVKELVDMLTTPLPQSLFIEYVEQKCKLVLAKSKINVPVLNQPSLLGKTFLMQLQAHGIKVKGQAKTQKNYRLNDRIVLYFLRPGFPKKQKVIAKMMSQLHPDTKLIEFSTNSTIKQVESLLSQLQQIDSKAFAPQVLQSILSALSE